METSLSLNLSKIVRKTPWPLKLLAFCGPLATAVSAACLQLIYMIILSWESQAHAINEPKMYYFNVFQCISNMFKSYQKQWAVTRNPLSSLNFLNAFPIHKDQTMGIMGGGNLHSSRPFCWAPRPIKYGCFVGPLGKGHLFLVLGRCSQTFCGWGLRKHPSWWC